MKLFGLTGGVGMGKSTAAQFLCQRGLPLVDTDRLARQLVEPGQPALLEIRQSFGEECIGPDGRLRRAALAQRVFADEAARRRLESILHPRIRDQWLAQVAAWRESGVPAGLVDIPLLFETHAEILFDATICVACSEAAQRQRLLARGWATADIDQRVRAQWPIEKKLALATYVIWTEGSLAAHEEQIARILAAEGIEMSARIDSHCLNAVANRSGS